MSAFAATILTLVCVLCVLGAHLLWEERNSLKRRAKAAWTDACRHARTELDATGLTRLPAGLALVLTVTWTILFLAALGGLLWTIGTTVIALPELARNAPDELRWFLLTLTATSATLAAVVALPFTLLRTGFAARQTRTAEENLTTDLINKAVEGLGAQKEVSRIGRFYSGRVPYEDEVPFHGVDWLDEKPHDNIHDQQLDSKYSEWQVLTSTVPNIEVRLGAIYALERIAQDSPRDHIRVMEILCAYLRENAPARDARRHDLGPWPEYPENPTEGEMKARKKALEERRKALDLWIADLREHHAPRADIQAAITVIGRRSPAQIALELAPKEDSTPSYRLDLRKVTLQAADLSRLNFAAAQLGAAHLEGADLVGAHLEGARLVGAHLEGARLIVAHLERADLFRAHLERAHLVGAHLQGARLVGAHLEKANLVGAHLERASLIGARLERADLVGGHLEGANLGRAHLEEASLAQARMSEQTSFRPATLRGAGLQGVNLAVPITEDDLPRLLAEAFGDASVTLPADLEVGDPPLDHWTTEELNEADFIAAWRAHQRAIGYTPHE